MARFRTEAEMFPIVEQWQESEQTQKVFSAAHDISVSVLAYWLRRYRDCQADLSNESDGFVAVQLSASSRVPWKCVYLRGQPAWRGFAF